MALLSFKLFNQIRYFKMKTHEIAIFEDSKTVKRQTKQLQKFKGNMLYILTLRWDDSCGNGHNSFAITLDILEKTRKRNFEIHDLKEIIKADGTTSIYECVSGGCQHDAVARIFPEYKHLISWHLCSSNAPLHYIENTTYHAKQGNLDFARSSACLPDATLEQLQDESYLMQQLPELMKAFKADIVGAGFKW